MTETAKQAYLCIDGWAGRHDYAVLVIGETPKRYRIRAVVENTPLGGRKWLRIGEEGLAPKYAVRFT